ncbi:MAG TPA: hypothetical protein VFK04_19900 [Gemmatimonadaceae bacterium]|nr:hypothetical protein [Gemmatimonadaceae bacterium]
MFKQSLTALADDLEKRGGLNVRECFVDAKVPSTKRWAALGPTRWKGTKIMAKAIGGGR